MHDSKVFTPLGSARLTAFEFRFLSFLLMGYPQAMSRESLMTIFKEDAYSTNIMSVYVCKVNKRIDGLGIRIKNIWGFGYRLHIDKTAFATLVD